jgi:hypothetical protein
MDPDEFWTYSPKQRLGLAVVAGVGLLLLFLGVKYEAHKFASKVAEVIGEALFLAVFVDVFFVFFYSEARAKEKELIKEAQNQPARVDLFLSDSTHDETQDRLRDIQGKVNRLGETLEGLSRQINQRRTG